MVTNLLESIGLPTLSLMDMNVIEGITLVGLMSMPSSLAKKSNT